ncbi:MAG: hypothetical protein ABI239_08000, partial [Aquihabitans sp.]
DGHELCRSARAAYHERRAQIVAHMDPVDLEHINASIGLLVTAMERDRAATDGVATNMSH